MIGVHLLQIPPEGKHLEGEEDPGFLDLAEIGAKSAGPVHSSRPMARCAALSSRSSGVPRTMSEALIPTTGWSTGLNVAHFVSKAPLSAVTPITNSRSRPERRV